VNASTTVAGISSSRCNAAARSVASLFENSTGTEFKNLEDNAETAASMATLLRMNGHEVSVVPEGRAALDEAKAHSPDVVLLDIGLPSGMDGFEVARQMQEQRVEKRPLLIAVTGLSGEDDRRHSAEVGIDLHLVKPADTDDLLRLLARFQSIID
jgi:two-component system OmpR family response regulator